MIRLVILELIERGEAQNIEQSLMNIAKWQWTSESDRHCIENQCQLWRKERTALRNKIAFLHFHRGKRQFLIELTLIFANIFPTLIILHLFDALDERKRCRAVPFHVKHNLVERIRQSSIVRP